MANIAGIPRDPTGVRICGLLASEGDDAAAAANAAAEAAEGALKLAAHLRVGMVLGVMATAWPAGVVMAAPNMPGIDISPIFQDVSLAPDQATGTYQVSISNKSNEPQPFKLSTVDFGSLNESGGVAFLGVSSSSFAQKYGLSKWMQLDKTSVTIPPNSTTDVTVTVQNTDDLKPGGHYGAILATALTAPTGPPAKSRVGVLEVLSSLILLVKGGGSAPELRLVSQDLSRAAWQMPSSVSDRFQDAGDTHVVPRGVIEVRGPLGKLVERGVLNEDSGIILPQSFRKYRTTLVKIAAAKWPGRYSVVTSYRYDGSREQKKFATSFWYLGAWYVWAAGVGIFLAAGAGVWLVGRWRRKRRRRTKAVR